MTTETKTEAGAVALKTGILLQVGLGAKPQPQFVSMDPDGEVKHDHRQLPWPFEDASVLTVLAPHRAQYVDRGADGRGFIRWMNEAWRVLVPGGQVNLIVPYAGNGICLADPCATNFLTERTPFYFDPEHMSGLWKAYRPKPWMLEAANYNPVGTLELIMRKRGES